MTVVLDVATRSICAAVLRPQGTKAVDAAPLLAKMLVPEPARPGTPTDKGHVERTFGSIRALGGGPPATALRPAAQPHPSPPRTGSKPTKSYSSASATHHFSSPTYYAASPPQQMPPSQAGCSPADPPDSPAPTPPSPANCARSAYRSGLPARETRRRGGSARRSHAVGRRSRTSAAGVGTGRHQTPRPGPDPRRLPQTADPPPARRPVSPHLLPDDHPGPPGSAQRVHQSGDIGIQPLLHGSRRQLRPACLPPWIRHQLHFF